MAQPFDARTLEFSGDPMPIGDKLAPGDLGLVAFSASRNGILAFRPGADRAASSCGSTAAARKTASASPDAEHGDFASSPDGTRLAVDISGDQGLGHLDPRPRPRTTTRFTFEPAPTSVRCGRPTAAGSPSRRTAAARLDLYIKNAAGTGEEQLLLADKSEKFATDCSRDGRWLVFNRRSGNTAWDISALPLSGEKKPFPIAATQFVELAALLSPDARFVAFQSNESGRNEVYVQEFPEASSKWQVSTAGGRQPSWRADGREIYYRAPDGTLMAVPVTERRRLRGGHAAAPLPATLDGHTGSRA